ncbi:MAG: beta-ketoacyl-[acyl-carrier-protein] synthase II [Bdellovibrionaceae bacterium]|nr:beta-ketoacyl-[acyl-carrier-protein] synthase II [Pseudobdellovibrionaceae bacterium]
MAQRRVVVTGMGAMSPLGLDASTNWESALNGKSGIDKITSLDCSNFNVSIGGEIKGFDPENFIDKKEIKKMDRFIQISIAATDEALKDSGIEFTEALKERTGCIIGVGIGGLISIEENHKILMERGPSRVTPFFIPKVITNLASGQISIKHGLKGPNYTVTSACASGNHSIGDAALLIRNGMADVMVAGGSEAAICSMAVVGFGNMRALSTRNNEPTAASRPWDEDRDGFVLGEAAATLILEDYEHACKRGAKIYAELTGYGMSSDAHHMTTPSEGGVGAAQAMNLSLQDANLNPEDIKYINAHGTSTPAGDIVEADAVKLAFKDHSKNIWMSSTKSMTGHTLGAAGALESFFTIMSVYKNCAPPTINLDNPSEGCDLDFIPHTAREGNIEHALNNSFGFGGTNACLIFSKCKPI